MSLLDAPECDSWLQVDFLLPDDHPTVQAELAHLQEVASNRKPETRAKWAQAHMAIAEKCVVLRSVGCVFDDSYHVTY